ncbi:unnamed protein product [Eruca vesicaria subsp. sativa]|uniref:Uncharacterized protein n=1 Tax=Eruca vesicaria subsp. sativa TaxID=29727 RepID=A0ABC8LX68_ERUVS|nr:unnamed protein product [Eruca vesicaria subsp. sativa]
MNKSSQVIEFLFLVEQLVFARNLIACLVPLDDRYMANKVVECLSILCNQDYYTRHVRHNHKNNDEVVIPLLKKITDSYLTLRYINENCETLLVGVTKNLSDVWIRAFDDIYEKGTPVRVSAPKVRVPAPAVKEEAKAAGTETERAEAEEEVTQADYRTLFLTFSKGYSISESEVRVYFNRKFGEVIETIVMDEGKENKQPLFARMVLKMQYAAYCMRQRLKRS